MSLGDAVVAGMDLNGLGIVRSLARAGVRVTAIDTDTGRPPMKSRFGTKLKVAALHGPRFVDELVKLRDRFAAKPVLFLTQEASVVTASAARSSLTELYYFTMPNHTLMERLLDKNGFQRLAEDCGYSIPRVVRVTRDSDLDLLQFLRFPCVLKPARKDLDYGKQFAKAYRVDGPDQVVRLWRKIRSVLSDVIVQEWIEGDDTDVYFCLQYRARTGTIVSFVGRKLVQWPPLVGGTAFCIAAPEAASSLIDLTNRFFTAVGFVGLGSIEYKKDRRDGVYYMIEPTVGRTDLQEEIATLNGVNIPLEALLLETGSAPSVPVGTARRRAWRDPIGCANAERAGAGLFPAGLIRDVEVFDAYLRAYDPVPYLSLRAQIVRAGIARRLGRNAISR